MRLQSIATFNLIKYIAYCISSLTVLLFPVILISFIFSSIRFCFFSSSVLSYSSWFFNLYLSLKASIVCWHKASAMEEKQEDKKSFAELEKDYKTLKSNYEQLEKKYNNLYQFANFINIIK